MENSFLLNSGRTVTINYSSVPFALSFISNEEHGSARWPPIINQLGVVLLNKCLSGCDHCYNMSSPKGSLEISPENIFKLIDYLISYNQPLHTVGLSGGEPFLSGNLYEIIHSIKLKRLNVSCSTGGVGVTENNIIQAAKSGLDGLVFSWDKFHHKFIDEGSLIQLVKRANDLIPQVKISVSLEKECDVSKISNRLDCLLPTNIEIEIHPLFSVGRSITSEKLSNNWKLIKSHNCLEEFRSMSINYDGSVYPCCSICGFTDKLKLFNIEKLSLNKPLKSYYEANHFVKKLATNELSDFTKEKGCSSKHKCEICHHFNTIIVENLAV